MLETAITIQGISLVLIAYILYKIKKYHTSLTERQKALDNKTDLPKRDMANFETDLKSYKDMA